MLCVLRSHYLYCIEDLYIQTGCRSSRSSQSSTCTLLENDSLSDEVGKDKELQYRVRAEQECDSASEYESDATTFEDLNE